MFATRGHELGKLAILRSARSPDFILNQGLVSLLDFCKGFLSCLAHQLTGVGAEFLQGWSSRLSGGSDFPECERGMPAHRPIRIVQGFYQRWYGIRRFRPNFPQSEGGVLPNQAVRTL
jgi:hypothetical protein